MNVMNGNYIMHIQICLLDYIKCNVPASKGEQFIRPRMLYGLSNDLSLEDPIKPYSKANDLLLSKKLCQACIYR